MKMEAMSERVSDRGHNPRRNELVGARERELFEAEAELGGGLAMAGEAEGAEVVEVTLAPAFGYGADVVGIPEGAAADDGLQAVEAKASGAGGALGRA